ncbi:MAG: HAD-IIB family hydrolase [Bryobacterales bacterium]|nr:HAD-IIB family hydrolase [Bryobacterales bacterium]
MLVIFTDLDGTLLDKRNYSCDAAREALKELRRRKIPLVAVTSKTNAELAALHGLLNIEYPYIVENGAAIYYSAAYVVRFGSPYTQMVELLERAARESGVAVRGFSGMTPLEVAAVTGLTLEAATLAKVREHDEPFLVDGPDVAPLLRAIERMGKRWTRGGRFFHIHDAIDKGEAVRVVSNHFRSRWGQVVTVGLGDAPNDIPMLAVCDHAVIVGDEFATEMQRALPRARVTAEGGPAGWNRAVLELIGHTAAEEANSGTGMVTTGEDDAMAT